MSSKSKHQTGFGDLKQDQDTLQAVVVADSFNVRFAPLTENTPRVLLPLVNCPILEYTLEYLKASGIQEVFLLCCIHAQQIKKYLKSSRWPATVTDSDPMAVTPLVSEGSLSLGDALRELDTQGLIRGDFVLISGDIVANLPLAPILQNHKKQTLKDKGCIMTMVFRKAVPKHRTRCLEDEVVICIEASTSRILHYQKLAGLKKFELPLTLFQEHQEVIVRHDILDTHISICSKHVPTLFVDNFDFQTRDDFVKGILINEEILGQSIYLSTAENGYAARVSNFSMYDSISQDMIQRWSYPLVPDMMLNKGDPYSYLRHNVYLQGDVDRARACTLDKNVVIGQGSKVGENSYIVNSIIGKNCRIGNNVKIKGSYIWDNVTVDDNCQLNNCLLADSVTVKRNCYITHGCVLSFKVIIGPDVQLQSGTLLHAKFPFDENDFHQDSATPQTVPEYDLNLVGNEGCGYRYAASLGSESDGEESPFLETSWGQDLHTDEEDEEEEAFLASSVSDEDSHRGDTPVPDDVKLFYNEVLESLVRGVEERVKSENSVLEINSSKYAYNITMKEVNSVVIKAILDIPSAQADQPIKTEKVMTSIECLNYLLPVLKNYIRSAESQEDCLLALEDYSLSSDSFAPVLIKVLKVLYDNDILDEEAILKWYKTPSPNLEFTNTEQKSLRTKVTRFIEWLQEAEEESE